jgi:hypothetical protein
MNDIVPSSASNALMPRDMDQAIRMAKAMSSTKLVPKHLRDDPGACLMIVEQAARWNMSPFAVAQCTSLIGEKLMYEGKIVAAAVASMGAITGHFDYKYDGSGEDRKVTVSATRSGEKEPRAIEAIWKDVKTTNEFWKKQPDQQLAYAGTRIWARRWAPAALLGVYSPEEFDRTTGQIVTDEGPVIEHEPEPTSPTAPPTQNNGDGTEAKITDKIQELVAKLADTDSMVAHHRLVTDQEVSKVIAWIRKARPARYRTELEPAINESVERNKPPPATIAYPPQPPIENAPENDPGLNFDEAVDAAS